MNLLLDDAFTDHEPEGVVLFVKKVGIDAGDGMGFLGEVTHVVSFRSELGGTHNTNTVTLQAGPKERQLRREKSARGEL